MIRVVLDTNQIISAVLNPGGAADRLFKASGLVGEAQYELVLSEPILEEIKAVLDYPRLQDLLGWSKHDKVVFLQLLREHATVVKALETSEQIVEVDPDDDKFFHAAIAADAKAIISRDKHLLRIKNYKGIRVLSPEVFLSVLRVGIDTAL